MNIRTKDNLVVIVAGIGMLLSTLDTGIINVALPFLNLTLKLQQILLLLQLRVILLALLFLFFLLDYLVINLVNYRSRILG